LPDVLHGEETEAGKEVGGHGFRLVQHDVVDGFFRAARVAIAARDAFSYV
jgi:hypothetical protein